MKVAVITANIGNFDPILGLPKQNVEIDYFYYTENNLPFPLPNLDNRLRSKYVKIQPHRFLPGYDVYIWVDGRIEISGINFAEVFLDQLIGYDFAVYRHRERKGVYEEMNFINQQMNQGNQYLLSRYGSQQFMKEALFYKEQGLPEDYSLFMSGVFARRNNEVANKACDEWWARTIEFSYFDQAMLSYTLWKNKVEVNELAYDELRTHKLFKITKHNK